MVTTFEIGNWILVADYRKSKRNPGVENVCWLASLRLSRILSSVGSEDSQSEPCVYLSGNNLPGISIAPAASSDGKSFLFDVSTYIPDDICDGELPDYSQLSLTVSIVMDGTVDGSLAVPVVVDESSTLNSETPQDASTGTSQYEITGQEKNAAPTSKINGWERKLLDLSLRNNMLNLRPGRSILQIRETDIPTIITLIKGKELSSVVGKPENTDQLKNLYRAARLSIEENGSNSLFVALGTLKWFDTDKPKQHIAPLIFIPVKIIRRKAMSYVIEPTDDEPTLNVTLLEMLRQMFKVDFPDLTSVPMRDDGFPDYEIIFSMFMEQVIEINKYQKPNKKWQLSAESHIGIFSFTKFLMWKDIHVNSDILSRHEVIRGMIKGRYKCDSPAENDLFETEKTELADLMLPVDYDSSQMEAVSATHGGKTFVLHGPPGTGKSQTITNIIADAILSGKKVLFVSEKKAALDVVKKRLDKIGLTNFCLELHSNKTDKKSFFGQLKKSFISSYGSLESYDDVNESYSQVSRSLTSLRDSIAKVSDAVNSELNGESSVYNCINKYLTTEDMPHLLSYAEVSKIKESQIDGLYEMLKTLDIVEEIIGRHPSEVDLVGLYPRENSVENQDKLCSTLGKIPDLLAEVHKKANSFFNRIFVRRSEFDILSRNIIWNDLNSLATLDIPVDSEFRDLENTLIRWCNSSDYLRKWYYFSDKWNEMMQYKVPKIIDIYLEHRKGLEVAKIVKKDFYRNMVEHRLSVDKTLREFNGVLLKNDIELYCKSTDTFQDLRNKYLIGKMKSRAKEQCPESLQEEKALLDKRIFNNGRAIALRRVIGESFHALQRMFPCMLMSPLSVAQYLQMNSDMYDLVIFDEASQLETADAVGAISRGRSLVVVGDPKQLPPTRFFTTNGGDNDDFEESEDGESIIDDCLLIGVPSKYLSRHYRSRHESLISFSNNNFYDGRLLTFPSFNDKEKKVIFIDPHGVYDYGKSRTNVKEAEAVADYVVSLLKENESKSIGVVTLSKVQCNLIEDLITTRLSKEKNFQHVFDDSAEPIFVKNLENVQGDERDIIIFSVGYGPDINGRVSLNFGPINKAGGEKRLNVAVTRAREQMVVFSSLHSYHIPSEGVSSKGLNIFREFLRFAEEEMEQDPGKPSGSEADVIVENIASEIRKYGYEVHTKVGRGKFRVDIGVIDPLWPNAYQLGILLDGRHYHSISTVRDREVTIPTQLKSLGWDILRIWVIDWFEKPGITLRTILNRLSYLREQKEKSISEIAAHDLLVEMSENISFNNLVDKIKRN